MANENKFGLSKDRLYSKGLVMEEREGVHCNKEDAFTIRSASPTRVRPKEFSFMERSKQH